jgi:hypothetical protein
MKKFLLLVLFTAVCTELYSDTSLNNLNDLLKQSGSFTKPSETKPAIEPVIGETEKNSIKEKDFFAQSDKIYENKTLAGLNDLFKKNTGFLLISQYIDQNIKDLDSKNADEMLLMFENFYYSIPSDSDIFIEDEELMDKKFGKIVLEEGKKYNNDYTMLIKNYKTVENGELSKYLNSLYDRNLNLTYSNGYFYFTVNYNKLLTYEKYLSEDMVNYLKYSDNEIRRPAVINSKIVIPLDDLVNRILSAEHYIQLSQNDDLKKEFAKMLVFHFENLMLGVGDTPVFSSETNTLNDNFLKSYKYYISKNGIFKSDLQKYIDTLDKNQYVKAADTYGNQVKLVNNVISYYKLKRDETFQ